MSEPRFGPSVNFDKAYEVYMARHDSMNGDDYYSEDINGPLPSNKTTRTPDGALDMSRLAPTLRSFHAGTDRGELMALLREAWGPSPAIAQPSDLRGLAARESQR